MLLNVLIKFLLEFMGCLLALGVFVCLHVFLPFLQRERTVVISCLIPLVTKEAYNGVYSERKEFALMGANSFLSE